MASLLYVDDEETIGRAVEPMVRASRPRGAPGAVDRRSAKQILAEHEPAAIFLDVWLGKESGFELMGWIEDARPELADRVTFVTGELADSHEHRHRVWKTLGRPVLQKPFELRPARVARFRRGGCAAEGGHVTCTRVAPRESDRRPAAPAPKRATARRCPAWRRRSPSSARTRRPTGRRSRADSGASPRRTSRAATRSTLLHDGRHLRGDARDDRRGARDGRARELHLPLRRDGAALRQRARSTRWSAA